MSPGDRKQKGRFIDPDDVNSLSEEQKEYFLKRGYLPYLSPSGKIKWVLPGHDVIQNQQREGMKGGAMPVNRSMGPRIKQIVSLVVYGGLLIGLTIGAFVLFKLYL